MSLPDRVLVGLELFLWGGLSDQEVSLRAEGICLRRSSAGNRVVEQPQQSGLAGVRQ